MKRYSESIAMAAKREAPQKHSWIRDQLDSGNPPQIEAPYFAPDLGSWVLSRYVDILAAFHAPSLIPGRRDLANVSLDSEEKARFRMREEVRDALCPSNVRVWREELMANSESLCAQLPLAEPIDLISAYLRPLCLALPPRSPVSRGTTQLTSQISLRSHRQQLLIRKTPSCTLAPRMPTEPFVLTLTQVPNLCVIPDLLASRRPFSASSALHGLL